jgi:alpha-D-ribose 1-methylphosphonate 5-triphosphate synthase subunit PhnH
MTTTTRVPEPGFSVPVQGAQQTFRALLDALARPTRPVSTPTEIGVPESLTPAAAATVLTLCDDATVLWIDESLRDPNGDVEAWLRFHSGAAITDDPAKAAFAIVSSPAALPDLGVFAKGTDEAPHLSATIIVIDADGAPGATFTATGPGFEFPAEWVAPAFPADFSQHWAANAARFPRGVDIVIAGRDTVAGLPRTTRLTEVD